MKDTLVGRRFSRLTVIAFAGRRGKYQVKYWLCRCDCGNEKEVRGSHLTAGKIKSCNCLMKEAAAVRQFKHGQSVGQGTSEYTIWLGMKARCYRESEPAYKNYGARGITVCACWLESFENFYVDMGRRPKGTSLERIDNEKGYEAGNCKWGTILEQSNNKRSNVWVDYAGQKMTLPQLARLKSIDYKSLWHFIHTRRLPLEQAVLRASPRKE